jgi:sulfate adenylyltransferase
VCSSDLAQTVYKTTEALHPGVAAVMARGDVLLGGDVDVFALPRRTDFAPLRLTPAQTRATFTQRGWRTVAGFQTRNPLHRGHEYLLHKALETVDGIFLHPWVGPSKSDEAPLEARVRSYETLLQRYLPASRILLGVASLNMHYAGPREAIWHALIRKNYGCSHFIVGRDHAGVGEYYGPIDAQRIFGTFHSDELGIRPLVFDEVFWCRRCGDLATDKTCVHPPLDRMPLAGNKVREMLRTRKRPPVEYMRPEAADVLLKSLPALKSGWV